MRAINARIAMVVALGLTAVGCTDFHGTVVRYDEGRGVIVRNAPETSTYALVRDNDFAPSAKVRVNQGQLLGFKAGWEDDVLAVAGDEEFQLEEGHDYQWAKVAD